MTSVCLIGPLPPAGLTLGVHAPTPLLEAGGMVGSYPEVFQAMAPRDEILRGFWWRAAHLARDLTERGWPSEVQRRASYLVWSLHRHGWLGRGREPLVIDFHDLTVLKAWTLDGAVWVRVQEPEFDRRRVLTLASWDRAIAAAAAAVAAPVVQPAPAVQVADPEPPRVRLPPPPPPPPEAFKADLFDFARIEPVGTP